MTSLSIGAKSAERTTVIMETTKGTIEIQLFDKKAPISVKNFLKYVDSKFYDGTIFHRVIDNFMIQGGGFDTNLKEKKTNAPIKNEASNRISNTKGTLAMARTSVVDSATGQFFINVNDNNFLDHKGTGSSEYGYAVFGQVLKGMSVVNMIKKAPKRRNGSHGDMPIENIIITKAYRKKIEKK
ncbi:peptidylprolyl isomerase A [Halobacteriovorax marinus]|uniref:Peptidyl-prolyl cis-trans isomerase n=1 Tax=Halobacteriovorax marinus TaxID=97084 RepID=A0A1Y5F9A2_9BACT|nr:peptidylprolyl isomerase A [Halobacteriovorax marinus]